MDEDESTIQSENNLEEGEISSSDDDKTYTPLERPANYSASQPHSRFQVLPNEDSDSELSLRSSSDSDSDSGVKNKKSKIKLKRLKGRREETVKRKKYDIWSTKAQEDVLAETLNCCDVSLKDRSRDVESYDYTKSKFYRDRVSNKRTRDDLFNPNLRAKGRSNNAQQQKGPARSILDLIVTSESSNEDIAKDIANKLYEEKEDLILRVVHTLGKEKTLLIYKETKRIEEEGGMLIMNQTRRRTPGGVFLFLVRHDDDLTHEQRDKIFDDEVEKQKHILRKRQKRKLLKLKEEIAQSRTKLLPDLLTRAELLASNGNRTRKETEDDNVKNPPPSPETDCLSGDGMEGETRHDLINNSARKIESYDDDFLDIGCSNDMDLF